ncbi:MAG: hypothetical protein JSR34_11105 [Proteobacteria bacterium]|nr:hypothetical protein [Pseudomonadota bacterium]
MTTKKQLAAKRDPLAKWRDKQMFTLSDTAALLVDGAYPHKTYPPRSVNWTAEERTEYDAVTGALRELVAAAQAKTLPAQLNYSQAQIKQSFVTGERYVARIGGEILPGSSTVMREDVKRWLVEHHPSWLPAFFFPEDGAESGGSRPLGRLERENLLRLIGVLCEAAGIDLRGETKGHAESTIIATWASPRNVTLTSEKIAEKVVAARELIRPIGPTPPTDAIDAQLRLQKRRKKRNK